MTNNKFINYKFTENNTCASIKIGKLVIEVQLLWIDFKDKLIDLINNQTFEKLFLTIEDLIKKEDFNNKIYLSILLTDNIYIKEVNKKYRKKLSSTNIISFPSKDFLNFKDEKTSIYGHSLYFGDIIISIEKIISESREQNKNFRNHFFHILVHGLLHLIGYDHNEDKSANDMEKLEISILKSVGIENPY